MSTNRTINQRNIPYAESQNNTNAENDKNSITSGNKKAKAKKIAILSIIVGSLLIIGLIVLIIIVVKKNKKGDVPQNEEEKEEKGVESQEENKDNNGKNQESPHPIIITKEEAMKAFAPIFKIKSKEETLTQLSFKSKKIYNTESNGVDSSYSVISKAIYDIYTLNSTSSGEDKDFYSIKYTTVITINSLCTKLLTNSLENDCELNKYLDLNIRNSNNLRRLNENDFEKVKEVILPICIIEHTDTNIILSVTCPETLSSNLKNDIILAFQTIKPDSANSINFNQDGTGTKTKEKDGKIYINSFSDECNNYDGDPKKNMTCETIRNIVTDKEGNLITSEKISNSETIIDEKNKYSYSLVYNFEDISNKNGGGFEPENYKSNLNTLFDLTKNLMKKENYISDGSFEEILEFLMAGDNITENKVTRNLMEENSEIPGVFEENVFTKTIYNINMTLNYKNDMGLGEGEGLKAKAITNFNTGEKPQELSNEEINTNLQKTMNEFITLSKAGNKMASELFEQLNDPLLNLRDIINDNIEELNNLLAFKQLSAIFDSTYAIDGIKKLPFKFIEATENLYKGLNGLKDDIPYVINDMKKKLKEDVSTFLDDSHELLHNIFKNLTEVTNSLSSKKSKIAEISSYYLNNTDTSYVSIIQQAKEIMDNYYINEKEKIEPLVDVMLNNFPETTLIDELKNIQASLNKISDKIDNGNLEINLANPTDYQNAIKNIYNANIKVDEIINNVKGKFKESINLQSNGYFEAQKEIDSNKQSYGQISERAINISYTLDNNDLIDKTFDNIMIYFRDQFTALLNYMDISKREHFPLRENVLSTSSFPSTYINEIDNNFTKEKLNIVNFIKDENKEYLDLINESINSVRSSSGNSLGQIINNIQNDLSDFNLNELNTVYNEILNTVINSINSIIETNNNLAVQYLNNVKNAGSTHITSKFINTYNIYINSLNQIKSFIQYNLKNYLASKYKNIITQIRANLQSIKSNEIIKKYIKQLPFTENHLRIIDNLYERLDSHISDALFNKNYLPIINNYVDKTYNYLISIENNYKNVYNALKSLSYSSSTSADYYRWEVYPYRCCSFKFGRCWRHTTCYSYHYVGYCVSGSQNHNNLKSLNFNEYTQKFDSLYNSFYSNFNNEIISYNNILIQIDNSLDLIKNNIINKNKDINYLNGISEDIKAIVNDKLGNNLLNSVYNYYKNELNTNLPTELNSILEQWKTTYDEIYEYLNTNISKFKSSITEMSSFSAFYLNTYSQNISIDYYDSVINKMKNDFNYTIKYYYNIILSKVNKTYSYILNNIPTNEKPFDEIINLRTNEVNQSYNDLLNQILDSKNNILKLNTQLNFLKVNENNFFFTNNLITENIGNINQELGEKVQKFGLLSNQNLKDDSEEIIVARFYLENAQNGKQIRDNYEQVNKATFIDLQNSAYQNLIEDIWEIDQDELINNIKNTLIKSNEKILNNFKYEKEKYINILQEKIYQEYYTKEDLEKEINTIYSNGLKKLDINSKNLIYGYLNEVLSRIKSHMSNEAKRLSNELTSYSKNYDVIKNRLNNYKNSIYNQFYNTILSVINDFYSEVIKYFYSDYIVKYLDEYKNYADESTFKIFKFLNISINLKEIITQNLELLINDYKDLAKSKIDFLKEKNIQEINELFVFSNIQNIIISEIDNAYNSILNPVFQNDTILNSGDKESEDLDYSDYDFSNTILDDIDKIIEQKIEETKAKIEEMRYNNFLKDNYTIPRDFSLVEIVEFKNIKDSFDNFTSVFKEQELKEFKNIVLENIKNNFKIIIDNFVPSFGKDFFDRILKYNELQKIKSLYNNLQYSITQSIIYYIALCTFQLNHDSPIQLPEDIKLKILTLNNLEETVKTKNIQVISKLNSKLDQFFEDTKNFIVEKYINEMKSDPNIELNFAQNIRTIIEQTLDGKRYIFENEYINIMNSIIKNPFIEQYTNTINKETNNMLYFAEKVKEGGRNELNKIFTLNTDTILSDIENKLNETLKAVKLYNNHFVTFKISNEIQIYLDNFGKDHIYPYFGYIKDILDTELKDLIMANLDKNSEEFEKEYSIEIFENKSNEINLNLTYYFNEMNSSLKRYGSTEEEYELNLKKEMGNYIRIRILEETDDEKIKYQQQAADYKLDQSLQELKNSSDSIKEFIESLNLFSNFEEKINKYINTLNYQNGVSEKVIKKNTDYYEELSAKLYELNSLSLKYYNKVNLTYNNLREFIIDKIQLINELIEKNSNITYKIIANKYIDIKNNFNPINKKINDSKDSIPEADYANEGDEELNYKITTNIDIFKINNEFTLDIIFEEEDVKKPKIVGKVINNNKPNNIKIDFSSKTGQICGKIGRIINAEINNISLSTNIIFDGGLNDAKINKHFGYDEYVINTKYYEFIEVAEVLELAGITFNLPNTCQYIEKVKPDNETSEEIIHSKMNNEIKTYNY